MIYLIFTIGTIGYVTSEALCETLVIERNPGTPQDFNSETAKLLPNYVNVLDCFSIFAENGVSDQTILYVGAMAAQILDNNEDGVVDDVMLKQKLIDNKALIPVFTSENSAAFQSWMDSYNGIAGAVLFVNEIDPTNPGIFQKDATFEEVVHNINIVQTLLYPNMLGLGNSNSALREAMDKARGGQYDMVPNVYPNTAWYTYDDTTCEYECQLIEYLYWGIGSYLGLFDDTRSCNGISNEWKICSASDLNRIDQALYQIVTDPTLQIPSKRPDNTYCGVPHANGASYIDHIGYNLQLCLIIALIST